MFVRRKIENCCRGSRKVFSIRECCALSGVTFCFVVGAIKCVCKYERYVDVFRKIYNGQSNVCSLVVNIFNF